LLRLLGREPAAQGVVEPADMVAALLALQAAIAASEAPPAAGDDDGPAQPVGLRQRLWPMVEMLRRAQTAQARVVWGV
jgi:hypothetical protein